MLILSVGKGICLFSLQKLPKAVFTHVVFFLFLYHKTGNNSQAKAMWISGESVN